MNSYCGFDLDRVPALKKALAAIPASATAQSRAVGNTVDNAYAAIDRGNGLSPKQMGNDDGSYSTDTDRAGFAAPATDATGVAADIGRRLAHLLACQKLQLDGYTIDPARVFDDESAPDETKIKNALAQARKVIGDGSPWDRVKDLGTLNTQLTGLTPAEAEAVIGDLSDAELGDLNKSYATNPLLGGIGESPLNNAVRIQLSNALFPGLSADQLRRFTAAMTSLQPPLGGTEGSGNEDQNGLHYQWADGQLFLLDASGKRIASQSDIDQGDLGDCWFLAGVGAEQMMNPNFAQQHMKDNGNGTYTVTFYKDGKEFPVTVDGQLPYNNWNPPQSSFEHPGSGNTTWVQIYEKAYAQYRGSYADIEGGYGDISMHDLTGKDTSRVDPDDTSFGDIQGKLASGVPVTVDTDSHHSGFLWHHSDEYFDNNKLVTKHVYIVQSVDNSVDPPTITLRNPWGGDENSTPPGIVTLTRDEFNSHMTDVSFGG